MSIINTIPINTKNKVLHIPSHFFDHMLMATKVCSVEMSMLGILKRVSSGLVLDHLVIPEQKVGKTHAQIDGEVINKVVSDLTFKGLLVPKPTNRYLRFAWHSHVDGPAKMSPMDHSTFDRLGGNGGELDPDWFVSMVMNRQGEFQVILDLFKPIRKIVDITGSTITSSPMFADPKLVSDIIDNVKLGPQTTMGNKDL